MLSNLSLLSAKFVLIILKCSSVKRTFPGDSPGAIAMNQTIREVGLCFTKLCTFTHDETYNILQYQISYNLNGHESNALHCVKNSNRHFNRFSNANSYNCIGFLLCWAKPELCHGKLMHHM